MASSFLEIHSIAVAYNNPSATTNPLKKHFDWKSEVKGLPVDKPSARQLEIPPGETVTLIDGARGVGDDLSETTLHLSRNCSDTYKLTWVDGPSPNFRTERVSPDVFDQQYAGITVHREFSMLDFQSLSEDLSSIAVGDSIYIAPTKNSNKHHFNPLNTGFWQVIDVDVDGKLLTCRRFEDQALQGKTESVTMTDGMVFIFGTKGVQVNDTLEIKKGFSPVVHGSYKIIEATARWLVFESKETLPEQVVKGAEISVYSNTKRFVRIEVDQPCWLNINGKESVLQVNPIEPGDPYTVGWFESFSNIWSLSVSNKSLFQNASLNVLTVE